MKFPSSDLVPPTARSENLALSLWRLPTNAIGLAVAWLLCSEKPTRFRGPASSAWLFRLPPGKHRWIGAVALGHVIVAAPGMLEGSSGPWTLAHELAHTRQHDVLGPLYLPLHGLMQAISTLASWIRPIPGYPGTHAYNPLERGFIAVPYDYLVRADLFEQRTHDVLLAFGVHEWSTPG